MPAIELRGLTKRYGSRRRLPGRGRRRKREGDKEETGGTLAVDDLSFSVESGEVFGYLGPNGAGKTTTIRTLLGFLSPTSGSASVLGADVSDETALLDVKRRIGYLPSEVEYDPGATGREIIDYHAALKGDVRSDELLELFDAPVDRRVSEYSTGNKRKLGLVLAFMHDPELVVMDEPTSGLDPLMQERFYDFLADEKTRGVTVFFSSHVLAEVRRVCDRVGILREGRLVALEDVETLLDRSGKRVRVRTLDPLGAGDFAVDGVHDREQYGEAELAFTFTGEYDALVSELSRHSVVDIDVREAPLEDVFMRFYGDIDPDTDTSADALADESADARSPQTATTGGDLDG
ncbi:ABC transporter [Haloprofundus marisrubri]|uniref:ABC transporter n=1 Tax=Haloprofundus marisrubri TaxID=1514971 RepID=A0A0W1RDX6_9EURY|nr:ABC transporter ATP-binding protein [Haloprofundus marisrubri]KTG11629.1 ABC transporter [Haloprofundus marisrubri]